MLIRVSLRGSSLYRLPSSWTHILSPAKEGASFQSQMLHEVLRLPSSKDVMSVACDFMPCQLPTRRT
jgi:hypothetical protein